MYMTQGCSGVLRDDDQLGLKHIELNQPMLQLSSIWFANEPIQRPYRVHTDEKL